MNKEKIVNIIYRLLLGAIILTVFLVPVGTVLAQEKVNLSLNVFRPFPDNVTPGSTNRVFAEVRNYGTEDITGISFSHEAPEGWEVSFQPETLDSLSPRGVATIDVIVDVDESVRDGSYTITLIADSSETRAITGLYFRVERETSFWLWVGAGIAAVVVIGFIIVFLRSERQ